MVNIIVDSELLAKLGDLQSPARLQDLSGRVLAYLTPVVDHSIYAELDPEISEEELARRETTGGGKQLSEILADFERNS